MQNKFVEVEAALNELLKQRFRRLTLSSFEEDEIAAIRKLIHLEMSPQEIFELLDHDRLD